MSMPSSGPSASGTSAPLTRTDGGAPATRRRSLPPLSATSCSHRSRRVVDPGVTCTGSGGDVALSSRIRRSMSCSGCILGGVFHDKLPTSNLQRPRHSQRPIPKKGLGVALEIGSWQWLGSWSLEVGSYPLLIPQHDHRVHAGGSIGGNEARDGRHQGDEDRNQRDGCRIAWLDIEQLCLQQA